MFSYNRVLLSYLFQDRKYNSNNFKALRSNIIVAFNLQWKIDLIGLKKHILKWI